MASSAVPCRCFLEKMFTSTLLQIRQKWQYPRRSLAVGDLVLVVAENTSRNHWPLERIQEVFPDKKRFVRKVKVSIKSVILERPVDKIVLLVEEERSKSRKKTFGERPLRISSVQPSNIEYPVNNLRLSSVFAFR